MPPLNFQPRFAPLVEAGTKRQTIRPLGKRTIKVGDRLVFYQGQRTKNCRKLGEAVCKSVERIKIIHGGKMRNEGMVWFEIDGKMKKISLCELGILASMDGFTSAEYGFRAKSEFLAFFRTRYGNRFEGTVIRW